MFLNTWENWIIQQYKNKIKRSWNKNSFYRIFYSYLFQDSFFGDLILFISKMKIDRIIFIFLFILENSLFSQQSTLRVVNQKNKPNKCQFHFKSCKSVFKTKLRLTCRHLDQNFSTSNTNMSSCRGLYSRSFFTVAFYLDEFDILEQAHFDLHGLLDLKTLVGAKDLDLEFQYINGFQLDFKQINKSFKLSSSIKIYESKFDFYSANGSRITACDSLSLDESSGDKRWILQTFSYAKLRIFKSTFKNPICPLVFNDSNINDMYIDNMINTFYKTNLLRFTNTSVGKMTLEKMKEVNFEHFVNIDVDSSLLSPLVFEKIRILILNGEVSSIRTGLLKSFKSLSQVNLRFYCARRLFHRGIAWIHDLNAGIHVNVSNKTQMQFSFRYFRYATITLTKTSVFTEVYYPNSENQIAFVFPDEDFCLYRDFPFEQLIVLSFDQDFNVTLEYTCTYLWLLQLYLPYLASNFDFFSSTRWLKVFYESNMTQKKIECDFNKR